jgi:hypothetical protein
MVVMVIVVVIAVVIAVVVPPPVRVDDTARQQAAGYQQRENDGQFGSHGSFLLDRDHFSIGAPDLEPVSVAAPKMGVQGG